MQKKVLYIHQYFKTPQEPGGTRSYWFSQKLLENNFEVTMLTSRNDQEKLICRENIDGINVIYIRNSYENNFSIFQRLFSFLRFMILSTYVVLREKRVNLVFSTSTPLTVGVPALFNFYLRGIDYVFEVRDLWPEVPIQMGAINSGFAKNILRRLEKFIYKKSLHIVALSPGMFDGVVAAGIDKSKVSMLPNMSKIDEFGPRKINTTLLDEFDIPKDKKKIIYFGAMGLANGIDFVCDLILESNKSNDTREVHWVFLGNGKESVKIDSLVVKKKVKNITFLPPKKMSIVSDLVNASDLSLVTFSNYPILGTNSPNKLFDSLSAAKPILVNSNGWTKDMVEKNQCGLYLNSDPKRAYSDIIELIYDKELMMLYSENSFSLAKNKFDKSIISEDFVQIIKKYV